MNNEDSIQDSPRTTSKRRSRNKLWLFLGIALMLIAGMAVTPAILRNIERNRDARCKYNIKQLSLTLKQYAMDYADRFPNGNGMEGLAKLQQGEYMNDYYFCYCPSNETKIAHAKLTDKNVPYVYFGGFMDTSSDCKGHTPEDMLPFCPVPVLFDRPGNHKDHINYIDEDGQSRTLQARAKNCSEFIEEMNSKFKYYPPLLKKLREKAAEADRRYYFP